MIKIPIFIPGFISIATLWVVAGTFLFSIYYTFFRDVSLAGPEAVSRPEAEAGGLRGGRAALRVGADRRPALRDLLHRPRQPAHAVREPRPCGQGRQPVCR